MGKRYYCDYCDKSFPDNPANRKKHMAGIQHDRRVKVHYFNFKDPEEILAEEYNKKPCRTLHQNGHCDFHPLCRFSHLTPEWEAQLRMKIDMKYQAEEAKKFEESQKRSKKESSPTLEGWMKRRTSLQGEASGLSKAPSRKEETGSIFKVPAELIDWPDLPPSLAPPSLDALVKAAECDWG